MRLRDDERRLRRIFEHAVIVALAAGPIAIPLACSAPGASSSTSTGTGGSPSGDADDAGVDASDAAVVDERCLPQPYIPDGATTCDNYVWLPCGLPPGVTPRDECYLIINDCSSICPRLSFNCQVTAPSCIDGGFAPDPDGGVSVICDVCLIGSGRTPAGLVPARAARARSLVGDHLARCAYGEAASVHAFRILRRELDEHGAPRELLLAARRAERDEVRHARAVRRLAARFGGRPVRARIARVAPRALEAIAIENLVEGCVRETYGALVARFQAATARDRAIAAAMDPIARDEARHAALAWSVARWAWPRLDEAARGRVVARYAIAIDALEREVGAEVAPELVEAVGLPNAAQRALLLKALRSELWGESLASKLAA